MTFWSLCVHRAGRRRPLHGPVRGPEQAGKPRRAGPVAARIRDGDVITAQRAAVRPL